jgi:transcriptional regulator with XRE-family HTH domain
MSSRFTVEDKYLQSPDSFRHAEFSLALLTESKMAEKLGITPRTLARWRRERKVPCIKIAGAIRYSWPRVRQALDAFEVKEAGRTELALPQEGTERKWIT